MAPQPRSITLRAVDDVLIDVTAAAKELIPGVDAAGVLLVGMGGTHTTLAPTSDLMFKLDDLQLATGEGPCLQAALDEIIVRTDDFRDEPRFPRCAPKVVIDVEHGRRGLLYERLFDIADALDVNVAELLP